MAVSKITWFMVAAAAAGAISGRFLVGASSPEMLQNRDRLAAMSPTQRERINQKFQSYLALPTDERARISQLYQDVEAERLAGNAQNLDVMESYIAWTATLPAYSREELRSQTVPGARFDLMRQMVDEQHQQKVDVPGGPMGGPGRRFVLSDLSKVIPVLERHLEPYLTVDEIEQLENFKGADRNAMVVSLVSSRLHPRQPPQVWSQALLADLAEVTGREAIRSPIEPERRIFVFVGIDMMLLQAARQELLRETASQRISDADLKSRFDSLSAAQQDELTQLSADDFRMALRFAYLAGNRQALQRLDSESQRIRREFGPSQFGRRPGEGFRPGENFRPDGDGPRDDRDRSRERNENDGPPREGPPRDGRPRGEGRYDGPPPQRPGENTRPRPGDF